MKYSEDKLSAIAAKLQEMPEIPKIKEYSKQEAVKFLKKEIVSLQKRGYTLDQISETLRGEGLEITTPTLKSYLQRSKRGSKTAGKQSGSTANGKASEKQETAQKAQKAKTSPAAFTPRNDTDDI